MPIQARWLCIIMSLFLSGCELVYLQQAARGQLAILKARTLISDLLAKDDLDSDKANKLALVLEIREFAREAGLDPGDTYLSYVDLQRSHAAWNVFAAGEFSTHLRQWCYPVIGCLSYRGYFDPKAAQRYAAWLEQQGYEVYVGPVGAYSTLGWFSDPVFNTFLGRDEISLAGLIFHELTHGRLFVPGDTSFNESMAVAVEHALLERWLESRGSIVLLQQHLQQYKDRQEFVAVVQALRQSLRSLYASDLSVAEKRVEKARLQEKTRERVAADPQLQRYTRWFDGPLNNAQLATVSTYNDLVPAFRALLDAHDGDLGRFFAACEALGRLDKNARHRELARWMPPVPDQTSIGSI